MTKWKHILINVNLIKTRTDKSVKIVFPNKSNYDGYCLWISKKLVSEDYWKAYICYTDDFIFNIKKYGRGRFNQFEVVDEQEITAKEFEEAFSAVDENISEKEYAPLLHIPPQLEPEKTEVIEELKDE